MTKQPAPLTPETVSAILRDPDSPYYPSRISVYCDHCGVTETAEFMVREDMNREQRLAVARQHLAANAGWEHTVGGDDFCPEHAGSPTEEQPAATRPLTVQQLADIEARTTATPDGPWALSDDLEGDGYPGHLWVVRTPASGPEEPDDQAAVVSIGDRALGEFIVHARTDVPALLAEIRQLRAEVTRRVQCNDCGAVGEVFTGDDGLAYLDPSGQVGHGASAAADAEVGEEIRVGEIEGAQR